MIPAAIISLAVYKTSRFLKSIQEAKEYPLSIEFSVTVYSWMEWCVNKSTKCWSLTDIPLKA